MADEIVIGGADSAVVDTADFGDGDIQLPHDSQVPDLSSVMAGIDMSVFTKARNLIDRPISPTVAEREGTDFSSIVNELNQGLDDFTQDMKRKERKVRGLDTGNPKFTKKSEPYSEQMVQRKLQKIHELEAVLEREKGRKGSTTKFDSRLSDSNMAKISTSGQHGKITATTSSFGPKDVVNTFVSHDTSEVGKRKKSHDWNSDGENMITTEETGTEMDNPRFYEGSDGGDMDPSGMSDVRSSGGPSLHSMAGHSGGSGRDSVKNPATQRLLEKRRNDAAEKKRQQELKEEEERENREKVQRLQELTKQRVAEKNKKLKAEKEREQRERELAEEQKMIKYDAATLAKQRESERRVLERKKEKTKAEMEKQREREQVEAEERRILRDKTIELQRKTEARIAARQEEKRKKEEEARKAEEHKKYRDEITKDLKEQLLSEAQKLAKERCRELVIQAREQERQEKEAKEREFEEKKMRLQWARQKYDSRKVVRGENVFQNLEKSPTKYVPPDGLAVSSNAQSMDADDDGNYGNGMSAMSSVRSQEGSSSSVRNFGQGDLQKLQKAGEHASGFAGGSASSAGSASGTASSNTRPSRRPSNAVPLEVQKRFGEGKLTPRSRNKPPLDLGIANRNRNMTNGSQQQQWNAQQGSSQKQQQQQRKGDRGQPGAVSKVQNSTTSSMIKVVAGGESHVYESELPDTALYEADTKFEIVGGSSQNKNGGHPDDYDPDEHNTYDDFVPQYKIADEDSQSRQGSKSQRFSQGNRPPKGGQIVFNQGTLQKHFKTDATKMVDSIYVSENPPSVEKSANQRRRKEPYKDEGQTAPEDEIYQNAVGAPAVGSTQLPQNIDLKNIPLRQVKNKLSTMHTVEPFPVHLNSYRESQNSQRSQRGQNSQQENLNSHRKNYSQRETQDQQSQHDSQKVQQEGQHYSQNSQQKQFNADVYYEDEPYDYSAAFEDGEYSDDDALNDPPPPDYIESMNTADEDEDDTVPFPKTKAASERIRKEQARIRQEAMLENLRNGKGQGAKGSLNPGGARPGVNPGNAQNAQYVSTGHPSGQQSGKGNAAFSGSHPGGKGNAMAMHTRNAGNSRGISYSTNSHQSESTTPRSQKPAAQPWKQKPIQTSGVDEYLKKVKGARRK